MWFERIAGLVIGQIALASLLAVVLWLLWARLRREQHLGFWSFSWAVTAVYVASLAGYVVAYQYQLANAAVLTEISLIGIAAAWLQPACMILAARSLRLGRIGRRELLFTFGAAILVGMVWSRAVWFTGGDPYQRLQLIVAPRAFLDAAGIACYALFFQRYHARARSFSGWLTIIFCLAYSAHLLLVALGDVGIHIYRDPNGLLNSAVATILPMGITLGIVISVLEQAQHSEGAIRSVWESAVAMRLTNPEGFVMRANPAFCAMMGRTREQAEGRLFTECYDSAIAGPVLGRYRQHFASRTVDSRVRRIFQRWDGRMLEVEFTNCFVDSPTGPQMLSFMQDTTGEHETAAALRRSEERLQLVLDSITDAVFDVRLDGTSPATYTRFSHMLGYDSDELAGDFQAWLRLLHPEDREQLAAKRVEALDVPGNLSQWEFRLRHKAGHWVWIRSLARVIERDAEGRAFRIVGTLTDISEFKAAEAQARRLESELLQTRKMEAIGRLAGGVAHDFNNHLTVINGYCDLLLNRPADGKVKERLSQIRTAGGRAADLTQQLLAVSRRQAVRPQTIRLNSLVLEAEKMLDRLIGENIEIIHRLDADLGPVEADPGQMHQVLMNLILNARDAMPKGGRITVQTANRHAPNGRYACVSVSDTGAGMPPEILEHVFEPFFTTKPAGAGTGLGLSTVYGIAQQAGGWAEVSSVQGQGSTFRVYLPVVERAGEESHGEAVLCDDLTGTETVLVVEDQPDLRTVSMEILREQGYNVLEAAGGEQALEICAKHAGTIHLLFTDIVMPGISGQELARQFQERRPDTGLLLTTGYSPMAIDTAIPRLAKPFTPIELCSKVREVLDRSGKAHTVSTGG
jgi:PAS domain S-box-containing protein